MSVLEIRWRLRRHRHPLSTLVAVFAVAFAIAAHHNGIAMDAMHHDAGMTTVAQMCLGVFAAVGAVIVAVGLAVLALGRWRPTLTLRPRAGLAVRAVSVARARHGPAAVSFLCVYRR